MITYAVLGSTTLSPAIFTSRYTPLLLTAAESRETQFIFSDESGCATLTAKFLNERGFRNCTIYHIGDKPRHRIGKYETKGGFLSYGEIETTLRDDADRIIEIREK